MAPRRLIPQAHIDKWEKQLQDAMHTVVDNQRAHVSRKLALHGIHSSLTAAGAKTAAATGVAVPLAWSQDNWVSELTQVLQPVADSVASDAYDSADDGLGNQAAAAGNDRTGTVATIAAGIMAAGIAMGVWLGQRTDDAAAGGAPGLPAGLSPADQVIQGVTNVFDTAPDIADGQIGAMANMAAQFASTDLGSYIARQQVLTEATQTWNTMADDSVRPDHADADGQTVALNTPFSVGGEDLMCPGDPSGSDEQTINCRCLLSFDGLPGSGGADDEEPDEGS